MNQNSSETTLFVIPCYNEADRINIEQYSRSLKNNPQINILFVNDGSSDNTIATLNALKKNAESQVDILDLKNNVGKAEAVRAGMQYAFKKEDKNIKYIGYLDADLATSLEEGINLSKSLSNNNKIEFAFGSRISKVGSKISRKSHRHFIGRFIASLISNVLNLRVYDTQCGAKVFSMELAEYVFEQPFISKWLFDVEIFARILTDGNKYSKDSMLEIPLNEWIDQDGSKVQMTYVFKMFFDLNNIKKSYPELRIRKMD
jgi:glycosyltransferase involved in cell wall biosynthesis